MTNNLPKQRDDNGHFLPGNTVGLNGRPAKVKEIEALAQQHAPEAFMRIVELVGHKDGKIALAAANAILDRAYGKPFQAMAATVEKIDVGRLYLEALKTMNSPPAGDEAPMKIVEGKARPIPAATSPPTPTRTVGDTRGTLPEKEVPT